jgi:hypothetical protein
MLISGRQPTWLLVVFVRGLFTVPAPAEQLRHPIALKLM